LLAHLVVATQQCCKSRKRLAKFDAMTPFQNHEMADEKLKPRSSLPASSVKTTHRWISLCVFGEKKNKRIQNR
jgi:hypothetical protein